MTEIEKTEGEIKVLQAKLELLKEMENFKTPVEEAYKRWWGDYPPTTPSVSNFDDNMWSAFQKGYTSAKEDCEVGEFQPKEKEQKWDVVRESVKWCKEHPDESVEEYLKPHTPEQVADGLKEAFREAIKQGVVSSVDKPKDDFMDKMVAKLKGQNLTDILYLWWSDVFTTHSDWDMETSIDDLVTRIEEWWLPKEQSAKGSQNAYVECSVEGFNDCLTKIKSKLR
jgi:hypothetical protein